MEERARTGSARLVVGSLELRIEVMAVEKAVGSLRLARERERRVWFGLGLSEEEASESEVEGEECGVEDGGDLLGGFSLSMIEMLSLESSRSMSEEEAEEARSMAGKLDGSISSAEEELL